MKICDMPLVDRPREKLMARGAHNLKDEELLAILFRTGKKGKSAIDLAKHLLKTHGMQTLPDCHLDDLVRLDGIDSGKACSLLAALELSRRSLQQYEEQLPIVSSPEDAVDLLSDIRTHKKEYFVVLYLNARNQVIHRETISIGSLNASIVHPREVFEPAVRMVASQIVLAHNHPSGDPEPSDADCVITRRIIEAGEILGIGVMDHVIIVKRGYWSFAQEGLISRE